MITQTGLLSISGRQVRLQIHCSSVLIIALNVHTDVTNKECSLAKHSRVGRLQQAAPIAACHSLHGPYMFASVNGTFINGINIMALWFNYGTAASIEKMMRSVRPIHLLF